MQALTTPQTKKLDVEINILLFTRQTCSDVIVKLLIRNFTHTNSLNISEIGITFIHRRFAIKISLISTFPHNSIHICS